MSVNNSDPIKTFVGRITYVRDEFGSGGVRYPNSYISFDFLGFGNTGSLPTAYKDYYSLADRNITLWGKDILPAYDKLKPHLASLAEDGKALSQWMEDSKRIYTTAAEDLSAYTSRIRGASQETIHSIHYWKNYFGKYASPLQHPELPTGIRELLMLEQKAASSSDSLYRRTLALFNASGIVYLGSEPPHTYYTSYEAAFAKPVSQIPTPQKRLAALVGCLGVVASAVPICLLFYQLSQTDNQFEVAKNFIHDMAISSLIPSFSAAIVYEGAKWMFS